MTPTSEFYEAKISLLEEERAWMMDYILQLKLQLQGVLNLSGNSTSSKAAHETPRVDETGETHETHETHETQNETMKRVSCVSRTSTERVRAFRKRAQALKNSHEAPPETAAFHETFQSVSCVSSPSLSREINNLNNKKIEREIEKNPRDETCETLEAIQPLTKNQQLEQKHQARTPLTSQQALFAKAPKPDAKAMAMTADWTPKPETLAHIADKRAAEGKAPLEGEAMAACLDKFRRFQMLKETRKRLSQWQSVFFTWAANEDLTRVKSTGMKATASTLSKQEARVQKLKAFANAKQLKNFWTSEVYDMERDWLFSERSYCGMPGIHSRDGTQPSVPLDYLRLFDFEVEMEVRTG